MKQQSKLGGDVQQMESDRIKALYEYNRWANDRIFEAVSRFAPERTEMATANKRKLDSPFPAKVRRAAETGIA
jgi:hypothetical protein